MHARIRRPTTRCLCITHVSRRDMANVDFDKTHLYGEGALRTVDDLKRVRACVSSVSSFSLFYTKPNTNTAKPTPSP